MNKNFGQKYSFWLFWALLLAALMGTYFSTNAEAAVYNFYFNNAEQGDNSTATPSVVVNSDKKTEEKGTPSDEDKKEEAKQEGPTQKSTSTPGKYSKKEEEFSHFRLLGGLGILANSTHREFTPIINATWFPSHYFGVNAVAGSIMGLEVEVMTTRLGAHLFDFGFLGGMAFCSRNDSSLLLGDGELGFDPLTVGARFSMNISESMGLAMTARVLPFLETRIGSDTWVADLGYFIRL